MFSLLGFISVSRRVVLIGFSKNFNVDYPYRICKDRLWRLEVRYNFYIFVHTCISIKDPRLCT